MVFFDDAIRRPDLLSRPTGTSNHSLPGQALLELSDPSVMALFVRSNNPTVAYLDLPRVVVGLS